MDKNTFSKVTSFIENWGSFHLSINKITNGNNMEDIKQTLTIQILEYIGTQSEFILLNTKIERIKTSYEKMKKNYNAKLVWIDFLKSQYELAKIAIAILSICPSETSVKRSFSMQSDVHSLERNRLSTDLIEAEMRIKMKIEK
jgi:hypothetical protein